MKTTSNHYRNLTNVSRVDGFITYRGNPCGIRIESRIDINQCESLPSFCLWTISSSDFTPVSRCYFIFPSRYLFAIGLSPIFSFRRSVPPNLRCTPKQRDSMNPDRTVDLYWHAMNRAITFHGDTFQCTFACLSNLVLGRKITICARS